jgi:hypothetical protein
VNTLPGLQAIAIALELSAANLLRNSCNSTYGQWYAAAYIMSSVSSEGNANDTVNKHVTYNTAICLYTISIYSTNLSMHEHSKA